MSESASVASALLADLDSDEDVLIVNVMITTETEADPAPVEEFGLTMLDKIDRSFNHAGPEEAEIDVTQSESAAQVITDKSDDRGAAAMCDNESIRNGSSAVTLGPEGDNGRGCKGPPAGCSQCETADCTSNCDTCGVLCEGCAVAHRRMKCLQAHKLNHLESENGKVIPTAHKSSCAEHDSNRQRWHWRWSESLPEPESRATEELEVLSHQKCPQLQPLSEPDQVPGLCTQWTIGCSSQVAGARNAESTNQLTRPRAVAVSQGLVYVCDAGADSKVQVFRASDGVFVRGIGGNVGSGVGQLDCPMSVAVDDGLVYVSDLTSHRIQVFRESDGHFVTTLGEGVGSGEGQLTQPSGLALDGKGFLFVAEIANNRVQRFRCPTDNLVS